MNNSDRREQIEQLILSYLKRNPDASDTLEGITRWWVEMERINSSVEQVAAACRNLEKMGLLKKINNPSDSTLYRSTGEAKSKEK